MKGIIAGLIAALLGALAWAIIAVVTGYEIGLLAWGIGAMVGAAVAWGMEKGPTAGVIAVVISILAIVAGKYITVEMAWAKETKAANKQVITLLEDDEYLTSWAAGTIIIELEEQNIPVEWAEDADFENLEISDYPEGVWEQAELALKEMTPEEKEQFKSEVKNQAEINMGEYVNSLKKGGFLDSFSLFDIIFAFLAIATAYKIAANEPVQLNNDQEQPTQPGPPDQT